MSGLERLKKLNKPFLRRFRIKKKYNLLLAKPRPYNSSKNEKVVLAYSGGLDTLTLLKVFKTKRI
jgi:tRNA(Ile)-lysidine synthase TilS/MesJ